MYVCVGLGVFSRSGGYSDGLFCATTATTPLCCHTSKERPWCGWAGEYRRANYGGIILRWELENLQRSMHWIGRQSSVLLIALLCTHCFSFFCYCRALVGSEGRNNLFCFQQRERWQLIQRRWYWYNHAVHLSIPADATAMTSDGSDTQTIRQPRTPLPQLAPLQDHPFHRRILWRAPLRRCWEIQDLPNPRSRKPLSGEHIVI